jgi:predicted nuclease of predicted toxin-antitoxin system
MSQTKLLLDANLSWRIIARIADSFPQCEHVFKTDLPQAASDLSIWDYALKHNYCIVTNDEDFYLLSMQKGFPPKIILLRTGNQSTSFLAEILIKHTEEIQQFLNHEEYGILELY